MRLSGHFRTVTIFESQQRRSVFAVTTPMPIKKHIGWWKLDGVAEFHLMGWRSELIGAGFWKPCNKATLS